MKRLGSAAAMFLLLLSGEARGVCNVSVTGLSFGPYDSFSAVPLDTTGTVSVTCDEAPPPDVVIAIGPSSQGGFSPRAMKHAARAERLEYNLFSDPSRSSVWGDGTAGTSTVSLFLKNVTKNRPRISTIYGRVFPRQDVPAGSYRDSLVVTITW